MLPYEFTDLADTATRYADEIEKLWQEKRDEIEERNRQIEEGVFTATADPKKTLVPPQTEGAPAVSRISRRSGTVCRRSPSLRRATRRHCARLRLRGSLAEVDRTLIGTERALTSPEGLPGRPWFRH